MEKVLLRLNNISKTYFSNTGQEERVLRGIDLELLERDIITIFGPNGCGKTTLLNIMSGLEQSDSGSIDNVAAINNIGYVFQNFGDTLLPWKTVIQNLILPLKLKQVDHKLAITKVNSLMDYFDLKYLENKYVYQLSGGQKQLIAVMRSLIYQPKLLLLDEPFSALDFAFSRQMWSLFSEFCLTNSITCVLVSHNIDEAIYLGNRLLVLSSKPGRITKEIKHELFHKAGLESLLSDEFISLRRAALKAFEKGIK